MSEDEEYLQSLLDQEAELANKRYYILEQIKELRGSTPPACWGEDDCSTMILMRCPWRIDCYIGDRNERRTG